MYKYGHWTGLIIGDGICKQQSLSRKYGQLTGENINLCQNNLLLSLFLPLKYQSLELYPSLYVTLCSLALIEVRHSGGCTYVCIWYATFHVLHCLQP